MPRRIEREREMDRARSRSRRAATRAKQHSLSAPWYDKVVGDGHDWASIEDRTERFGPFGTRREAVQKALQETLDYELDEGDVQRLKSGKQNTIDF